MKTIVLIGKTNEALRALHDCLRAHFQVHLSVGDAQSALGMVKVAQPDLAVVVLAGFSHGDRSLLLELQRGFPRMPVLLLGTAQESLPFASFCIGDQIQSLTLPMADEDILRAVCQKLALSASDMRAEREAAEEAGARKTVLVVDDNANTLRSIKAMLEGRYNVTLANSGMKAMTSIGKSRPDVILLDYEMPVCDGRQTLEMIRADEDLTTIPVIFLTSVNDKEHIQAVIKLLPAGYLLKPAVPAKLIEAIEKALAAV